MHRIEKKFCAAAIAAMLGSASSFAAISLVNTNTRTENFDSLPSSGTTTGAFTTGQSAIPGSSGFVGARIGGTGTSMNFIADDGSSNTGALFSYGTAGSTERALGSVASGTNIGAFGAEFVNNTGQNITSFNFIITREQWRSSTTAANTLSFAYGISGGTATSSNFLSDTNLIPLPAFDLVGDNVVTSNGQLNGNANGIVLSGVIPAPLNPGQSLFIRWQDFNDGGNDAGLAVDNLSITPVPVPEPIALSSLGALALLGLRKRNR